MGSSGGRERVGHGEGGGEKKGLSCGYISGGSGESIASNWEVVEVPAGTWVAGWGRIPKEAGKEGSTSRQRETPKCARPTRPSEGLPVPPPAPGRAAAPPPVQSRGF